MTGDDHPLVWTRGARRRGTPPYGGSARHGALLVLAVAAGLLAGSSTAGAQLVGVELIVNGDASSGTSGWTQVAGGFGIETGFPCDDGDCFWAGSGPGFEEQRQDVDVASIAAAIDAGAVTASFSGRSYSTQNPNPDDASYVVEYRDATSVLESFDSPAGPNGNWFFVSDERTLPVGTRTIRVRMLAFRATGNVTHAYHDDASIVLSALECADEADNDGDGLIDLADPDCDDPADDSEHLELAFTRTFTLDLANLSMMSVVDSGTARVSNIGVSPMYLELPEMTTTIWTPAQIDGGGFLPFFAHARLGTLTGTPLAGTLPITGTIGSSGISMTVGGTRGVGIGGSVIAGSTSFGGALFLTGHAWGTGLASANTLFGATLTRAGFMHGPASNTSSAASAGGVIQLVTPVELRAGPSPIDFTGFGVMDIQFVPEPTRFLMLAAGALMLGLLGPMRRRRR